MKIKKILKIDLVKYDPAIQYCKDCYNQNNKKTINKILSLYNRYYYLQTEGHYQNFEDNNDIQRTPACHPAAATNPSTATKTNFCSHDDAQFHRHTCVPSSGGCELGWPSACLHRCGRGAARLAAR